MRTLSILPGRKYSVHPRLKVKPDRTQKVDSRRDARDFEGHFLLVFGWRKRWI